MAPASACCWRSAPGKALATFARQHPGKPAGVAVVDVAAPPAGRAGRPARAARRPGRSSGRAASAVDWAAFHGGERRPQGAASHLSVRAPAFLGRSDARPERARVHRRGAAQRRHRGLVLRAGLAPDAAGAAVLLARRHRGARALAAVRRPARPRRAAGRAPGGRRPRGGAGRAGRGGGGLRPSRRARRRPLSGGARPARGLRGAARRSQGARLPTGRGGPCLECHRRRRRAAAGRPARAVAGERFLEPAGPVPGPQPVV